MSSQPDFWGLGMLVGVMHVVFLGIVYWFTKKTLDFEGAFTGVIGFLGCFNIFPPIYLLYFLSDEANRTRLVLPLDLKGDEKYIAIGAVCTLVLVLYGLVTTYQKALKPIGGRIICETCQRPF
jgi:hypothetical protein